MAYNTSKIEWDWPTLVENLEGCRCRSPDYPDSGPPSSYRMVRARWCNRSLVIQSAVRSFRCCFAHDVHPLHTNAPSLRDVFPCIRGFWHKSELLISVNVILARLFVFINEKSELTMVKAHAKCVSFVKCEIQVTTPIKIYRFILLQRNVQNSSHLARIPITRWEGG